MPKRKSSSDNGIGLMIIVAILGFAVIKAFDIHFTIANFQLLGLVGMSIVIGILYFFGSQSKKNYDENYYKTPDPQPEQAQEDDRYKPQNPYEQPEENKYGSQSYGHYNNNDNEQDRW